jgi:DnaJ-domain-containing protein 1
MRYPKQIQEADFPELIEIIKKEAREYVRIAKNCAHCSCNSDIQNLLSEDSLQQFLAISDAIGLPLKDVNYDIATLFGFDDSIEEQSRLMQTWITLGSAIEAALQMFLAIYLNDYQNSGWHKWVNYNEEKVKQEIINVINELSQNKHLDAAYAKSLKELVKNELKARRKIPPLNKVMLYDLIEFYRTQVEWDQEKINKLNEIREYRNCIHSFTPREIGNWEQLIDSLKYYCTLLLDLQSMAPDCDDMLAYEAELQAEMESYYSYY